MRDDERRMILFRLPRIRGLARAPLADLLAIMLAEIEQLDAGHICGFACPEDANRNLNWLRKTIEPEREASDKIGCQAPGRRDEETIFADIEKKALFRIVFVEGDEDRCLRDDARIKAAFDGRNQGRNLLG
jgi:hypothetical protein